MLWDGNSGIAMHAKKRSLSDTDTRSTDQSRHRPQVQESLLQSINAGVALVWMCAYWGALSRGSGCLDRCLATQQGRDWRHPPHSSFWQPCNDDLTCGSG